MKADLNLLRSLVYPIHPFGEQEWVQFAAIWKPLEVARKEKIIAPREQENYLYFVGEGVQRIYYLDDQNRETILAFAYPPSFGGIIDAFLMQKPSRYYYEPLTPSRFLRASYADLNALMDSDDWIDKMLRIGLAQTLSSVLERLVEVQCFSSEEKFKSLLLRSPHLLQLVPHK